MSIAAKSKQNSTALLDTSHLKEGLGRRSIRGGAVTLASQWFSLLISTIGLVVMARLLRPEDYGLMAMATAVTGFADLLRDIGLSQATIQRADITHEQVSTLFWINAAVGASLALVIAVLSPMIAAFYQQPQVTGIMLGLSVTFLFGGIAVQHQALLTRQMRFLPPALAQVASLIAGLAMGIVLGLRGFGVWALVANYIVTSIVLCVGLWIASGWVPGRPVRGAGMRGLLIFGSDVTGFNIINYFSRNLDNILIGRFSGTLALGLYSRAYQLLLLPINNLRDPLNRVALPALSRLQDSPEQYRSYYVKMVSVLGFVSMPLVAYMFAFSDNIICLVLGKQWMAASPLFKVLAITAFIQPVVSTRGAVLLSTGKSRRYVIWGLYNAIVVVAAFGIGIGWGAIGIAVAYAIANYLILYPSLWYTTQGTPVAVMDFLRAMLRPSIASIVTSGVGVMLQRFLVGQSDITVLLIGIVICVIVYLSVLLLFPNGRADLREYLRYIQLVFADRQKQQPSQ